MQKGWVSPIRINRNWKDGGDGGGGAAMGQEIEPI